GGVGRRAGGGGGAEELASKRPAASENPDGHRRAQSGFPQAVRPVRPAGDRAIEAIEATEGGRLFVEERLLVRAGHRALRDREALRTMAGRAERVDREAGAVDRTRFVRVAFGGGGDACGTRRGGRC